eukprot:CAMPEP_0195619568 /NCGR_PEP_ID=MMETSP0815-20121206/14686_1 /TAXON_ID=97485 /ORGANISM="Prymnesium parvum, Strain Texoma1" /LENGTH=155 /DNA_ID=CAMNT_0040760181 /DNA_START=177 /DNA_END=641 /DNA_ORIENTATION=-
MGSLPQQLSIRASTDDPATVLPRGAESFVGVQMQLVEWQRRANVPQPDATVVAAGEELVRAARGPRDAAHPPLVRQRQLERRLLQPRVPQPHGVVRVAGGDACVHQRHRDAQRRLLPAELRGARGGGHVPLAHAPVERRRVDQVGHRPAQRGDAV